MAVAWKKVITDGDIIPVESGGTGVIAIPSGALVGNAGGTAITAQHLGANEFLMGVGAAGSETATSITDPTTLNTTTADVGITGAGNGVRNFTLGDGVVTGGTGGKMATGTTNWDINEAAITGNAGGIAAFASAVDVSSGTVKTVPGGTTNVTSTGQPYVLATPGGETKVLKWNGSALEWGDTGSSSTDLTVTDDTTTNGALPISFVRDYSTDDNSPHFIDESDLTFNPSTDVMTVGGITLTGTTAVNTVTAAGPTAAPSVGFIGTATNATKVTVNDLDAETSPGNLEILIGGGVGAGQTVYSDSGLFYNSTGGDDNTGLLSVPNLTVNGTTTTVNSETLTISDKLITLAYDTGQNTYISDALVVGAGVALGVSAGSSAGLEGVAADVALPRLTYLGNGNTAASVSPSKWALTRTQENTVAGNAPMTNIKHGIAVMSNESTITGSTSMAGAAYGTDVGIGAFKIDQNGSLWIQTEVA